MGVAPAVAVVEGAKLITSLAQAKKGSSAVKQAAEQQRQAELRGRADMERAFQQQQQAVSPYLYGGAAFQDLSKFAWNPQTRQPMGMSQPGGMSGGMTMGSLFPGMGQRPPQPPAQYTNSGVGTTAQPDKTQMPDMADMGASVPNANMQSMFMRDPQTLMVREVPWNQVALLRSQGWTPVQSGGR